MLTMDTTMGLLHSWMETPVADEVCFEAMKAGMDALPPNTKMVLNGGAQLFNHPQSYLLPNTMPYQ